MAKTHPENLEDVKAVSISDELREFVSNLASDVEEEKFQRKWWDNKVDRYRALRYGIRLPKIKPWPKAANYNIPLIDADINRLKPSYVNLAFSVSPIVSFEPFGGEDIEPARLRELLFDWRMRTKVKFFKPYTLGVDRLLEQGQVIFKVLWKFSTRTYTESFDISDFDEETQGAVFDARVTDDVLAQIIQEEFRVDLEHEENVEAIQDAVKKFRDGETKFDIDFVETVDNQPDVIACDLREDLVIPLDTLHINDARFIDYIFPVTVNELKIAMQDGKYEEYDDFEIESWTGKEPGDKKNVLLSTSSDDIVWLHETCCWKDINDDGIMERCITTWPHANPNQVLRFIENPYDHGMWPYIQVRREHNDDGFYTSRGIPELDEDFQRGITTLFNQTIDNGTIVNNPQVVYKSRSLANTKNIRYVPGERVEVLTNTSDYEVRQLTNVSQGANLQLTQFLKGWANQRLGNQTSGVSDATNLPGGGQGGKKTAREVALIEGLETQIQSLDLQIFQQQMADVYFQIDALYNQWGDEVEEILITGQEPIEVSRSQVQGKFDMVPNGRLDNSNPQIRRQKSFTALQFFIDDPFIKQKELREFAANDLDERLAKRIVKSDEELQQEQQALLQQQQALQSQGLQQGLQLRKLDDDMDIRKEALMTEVTGKRFAPG